MTNNTNSKYEWHQSEGDFFKSIYDHLKHIATMSTASILVISSFLGKCSSKPLHSELVTISIVALIFSLTYSLMAYALLLMSFPRPRFEPSKVIVKLSVLSLVAMWLSFLIGISSVGGFFLSNWKELS